MESSACVTHAIRHVFELPPSPFCSSSVSCEALYGMKAFPFPLSSSSADTTRPSDVRDWLMFAASSNALPATPERETRSLPARSTRNIVLSGSSCGPQDGVRVYVCVEAW